MSIVMVFVPGIATLALLCGVAFCLRRLAGQNSMQRRGPHRPRRTLSRVGGFCGWFFGGLFTGTILGIMVGAACVVLTGGSLSDPNPHGGGQVLLLVFTGFGVYGGILSGLTVGIVSLFWK